MITDEYFSETINNFQEQFKFIETNLETIQQHQLEIGYKSIQDFKDTCQQSIETALSKNDEPSISKLRFDMASTTALCDAIKTFQDPDKSAARPLTKKILKTLNRFRLISTIEHQGQIYTIISLPVIKSCISNTIRHENNIIYQCKHESDEDAQACHEAIANLIKTSKINEVYENKHH
ncbi:MAG: hypothetical protein Hyperionvirus5_74 [Hyperionvirus sp.]|uniref:Uncharacterized protein n=1 Tax=Hyperionvirus sp. TaxID=2487770 RepID=A0A3G5A7W5_9VIRU|nr:MAG: hypothetical protein Hyperionvirus5_74 [Hyperionvirus sp.]